MKYKTIFKARDGTRRMSISVNDLLLERHLKGVRDTATASATEFRKAQQMREKIEAAEKNRL